MIGNEWDDAHAEGEEAPSAATLVFSLEGEGTWYELDLTAQEAGKLKRGMERERRPR